MIFLATQHVLELDIFELLQCFIEFRFGLSFSGVARFVKFVKCIEVVDLARDLFISCCPAFDLLNLTKDLLSVLGVIPEGGIQGLFFEQL
jgi:hypothetical protein